MDERGALTEQGDDPNHSRLPSWYVKGIWYAIFAVAVTICAWYVASKLTDLMITVAICA